MLSSYVEGHKIKEKFKSEFYVFGWFSGLQNLDVFFENFTFEQISKSF